MKKYCPQCHAEVDADHRICGYCGSVLDEEGVSNNGSLTKALVITGARDGVSDKTNEDMSEEIIGDHLEFDQAQESIVTDRSRQEETLNNRKTIDNAPVLTFGDWMITLLLLMIPIVNIVMLIIWSADAKTNPNKRHFAWAQLIYMGIMFVLGIIFSSILATIIISAFSSMNYY